MALLLAQNAIVGAVGTMQGVLASAFNAGPAATAAALTTHFNTLDTSLDGLIDLEEMKTALGGIAGDKKLSDIFKKVDLDQNGYITKLEASTVAKNDVAKDASITSATNGLPAIDTALDSVAKDSTLTDTDGLKTWLKTIVKVEYAAGRDQAQWLPVMAQRLYEISKFVGEGKKEKPIEGLDRTLYANKDNNITGVPWEVPKVVPDGLASGGIVGAYAPGGIVGNGIWNRDSVLARFAGGGNIALAGGEGVINAPAMRAIGPANLDFMNSAGRIPAADGRHFREQTAVLHSDIGNLMRVQMASTRAIIETLADRLERVERAVTKQGENTTRAVNQKPVAKVATKRG